MKKNIFIVNAYPNSERRIVSLKKTLKSLKHDEFDILLSTNYPISDPEIYEMIDYFVYDKQDIQDYYDYGRLMPDNGWSFNLDWCTLGVKYNSAYHYDLWRCLYNSLNLIKNLGYEYFWRTDGDNENMTEENIKEFINIRNNMFSENKKIVFFEPYDNIPFNGHTKENHFPGYFCGGDPAFFIENINLPYDINEWVQDNFLVTNSYEKWMFEGLKHKMDDIYLADIEILFKMNLNNIYRGSERMMKSFLYFEKDNFDKVYGFAYNTYDVKIDMEIYLNDELYLSHSFYPNNWYWNVFDVEIFKNAKYKQVLKFENYDTPEITEIELNEYNLAKMRFNNNVVMK